MDVIEDDFREPKIDGCEADTVGGCKVRDAD